MQIDFDPDKRAKALTERGLDFVRATEVFSGRHFTAEDPREDYSEPRYITVGKLDERMVVMVWTNGWSSWSGRHAARCAASSA